jgi:hypothetical protein
MKKLTILLLCLAFLGALSAQVTLEKTYNYSATIVKFETLGYKYYIMDVPASQCRIYNLDHSLYKTINCQVPSGCYLFDIKFLSENVFDSDSGIELLYSWYKYYSGSDYYDYDTKIINEDGSEIVFINGALYNYINKTEEDTYKLFSYCYDFSNFPEVIWTNIYSLPGAPTVNATIFENETDFLLNAYPNPTTNTLKVAYSLPQNVESGVLQVFDTSGRPVTQFVVDHFSDHLDMDVSKLSSGVYHYFIEYGDTKSPSKKLVIQ